MWTHRGTAAWAAALLSVAAACAGARGAGVAQPGQPGAAPSGQAVSACPVSIPGVRVTTADAASGEDVTFTTSDPASVEVVRGRVRAFAELRNERLQGGGAARRGASWATVENVTDGARLIVTTEDPIERDHLRDSVRTRAQRLAQAGGCSGDWMP